MRGCIIIFALGNKGQDVRAIKQEGSVKDYLQKFEELLPPLPKMAEDILVGTFTNGLDPMIKTEVFAMRTVNLEDMMDMAPLDEEKIEMVRKTQDPYGKRPKNQQ